MSFPQNPAQAAAIIHRIMCAGPLPDAEDLVRVVRCLSLIIGGSVEADVRGILHRMMLRYPQLHVPLSNEDLNRRTCDYRPFDEHWGRPA